MPDCERCRAGQRGLILLALLPLACCPAETYELTTPNPTVRLPLDEAPHCDGAEWWYYTGKLTADDGRSFGVEAVVFHAAVLRYILGQDGWFAHSALLDVAGNSLTYDQGRWLQPASGGTLTDRGVQLDTPLIQMTIDQGQDHIQAAASDGHFSLALDLQDERGPVLHDGGYIRYGPTTRSFYYSRPRMQAEGTLTLEGQPLRVTGQLWFDRQWGRSVVDFNSAWDWFSLRLDDGTSVMMFMFRGLASPVALGTYVPPEGDPLSLTAEDFSIAPSAWWTSPHTSRTYPVAWDVQIPSQDLAMTITAVIEDQELDARATTYNIYWEGLCTMDGTRDGQPIGGDAYVELLNEP